MTRFFSSYLLFLLLALIFAVCAAAKYYKESSARERIGGDAVIVQQNTPPDLGIFTFMSMNAAVKSEVITLDVKARAAETEDRAESEPKSVALKVIDRQYPLYGNFSLTNKTRPLTFASYALGKLQGAAVSREFLRALSLDPGEVFMIGNTAFLITAVIISEPDLPPHQAGQPRVIISNRAFDSLIKQGMHFNTPLTYEVRVKTPANADIDAWKESFDGLFKASGWQSTIWTEQVASPLLYVKMPFLLALSGFFFLAAMVQYVLRKKRAAK
jgi:predicted lysophospholipase L1 biosynthesis ABC-type transport system permease subunit